MNRIFKDIHGFASTGIIIALVVVGVGAALFFGLGPGGKEPIKIGAILSLTGPGSDAGEAVKDGLLLAVEEVNKWGGVRGRKLELIITDSRTSPQVAKEAFNRMEAEHHPLLYISNLSVISMALAPLAEENRVVIVGFAVTAPRFTGQNRWAFRFWPPAETEIEPILYILEELDIKNLGLVYIDDDFGRSVYELLKKDFEKPGKMVKGESFALKGANLKKGIEMFNDMEGIYIVGYPAHTMDAIKILRGGDFGGVILSTQVAATPEIMSLPETNGVYAAAPIIYNPNYLFAKEAKDRYETRYHKPFNQFAASGYDLVKLLASLLEEKDISRKSVQSLLEGGFIYPGVFGDLDIEAGEHDIVFPLYPARIVDGEVKYLYQ